jgi:hypothetical protein
VTRLVSAAALAAGLVVASLAFVTASKGSVHASAPGSNRAVVLSVGDRFRVEGVPLGCRVTRLRAYGGRVFVDCRRGGLLAGTYGTLMSDREVMLVRFRDAHTAKVVFQAKHEGRSSKCS